MNVMNRKLFANRNARRRLANMGGIMTSSPELMQAAQMFQTGGQATVLKTVAHPFGDYDIMSDGSAILKMTGSVIDPNNKGNTALLEELRNLPAKGTETNNKVSNILSGIFGGGGGEEVLEVSTENPYQADIDAAVESYTGASTNENNVPVFPPTDEQVEEVKKKVDKPTKEKPSKEEPKKEKPKKEKPSKEEPKKEKPKKEKPKKKKWTPKDGEANRPVSKAQKKREAKAKPKTVHDRGNGHFAGKNPDGNVQGFHGDYAEEQAELYSQGEAPSKKKSKAMKYKKDLKKAGWDPNDKSGKSAFAMDGGGTAWDEMMDGETPSKSWWSDLMDSFAKEAGELETK